MSKNRKVRVDLRKNRNKPARENQWTRAFQEHGFAADEGGARDERVRSKGDLSRKRTIITSDETTAEGAAEMPAVDASCLPGRVLRVHGLQSWVATNDGKQRRCVVRRVLRSLVIDERNVISAGDQVWVLPVGTEEGVIERIEPRHGLLRRESRGKEHVIVANVDQLAIIASLAEPGLKPHLIDRYLASAMQGGLRPIVCVNKIDLVDPQDYQVLLGTYHQLGIPTFFTSAVTGQGMDELRSHLAGRATVFAGQSGVGKSSLLNAVQPELGLRVAEVSETTQKGRHTTTTAELIPLASGGWVVDTPGIRQFALWDVRAEELEGLFPEIRPFVPHCTFPDCMHQFHNEGCAVRQAVQRHRIAIQRYESYVGMYEGRLME